MKVVILYEKAEQKVADAAAHIIESHQCDAVHCQIDRLWEKGAGSPTDILQDT